MPPFIPPKKNIDIKVRKRAGSKVLKREKEKPCPAVLYHGPGHQSSTNCQLTGPHEIHECVYGCEDQLARWRGQEKFTGYFDEPPTVRGE